VKAEVTHDLQRFLDAQASVYEQARSELAAGQKRSHWMWLIFPQIRGLGSSPTAQRFAISGLDEAIAYLNYPVLGARLRECTALVNGLQGRSLGEVFGYPDDLKFHSSITLFAASVDKGSPNDDDRVFRDALAKYFEGKADEATLDRL
jgi:uncharacterized protein (DUF1810 family)